MRWFFNNKSYGIGSGSGQSNVYNVVSPPNLYNGLMYGIQQNLNYRVLIGNNVRRVYPVDGYYTDTDFVRLIGVTDNRDLSLGGWSVEYENSTISGKYRFSKIVSGGILTTWAIPLNFQIEKIDGSKFRGNILRSISTNMSYPSRQDCGITFCNDGFYGDILQFGLASESSAELFEDLQYAIVDFGESPQNIPIFIKEWILANTTYVYPHTYTVRNQDDSEILATITEAPSMVSAKITVIGDQKTLTLLGSNGETYTTNWVSETPEGKVFLGLTNSPLSTRVTIPINVEREVSWVGDINLYECYGEYKEPITTFDMNLYNNSSEPNRIDKTDYITALSTISGVLRDECSLLNPVLTFEYVGVPTFNYVYIPIFNRYYFVNEIVSVNQNLWEMSLTVDVLMTYKDGIFSLSGFIDRNEYDYNEFIPDKKRLASLEYDVYEDVVENNVFVNTGYSYVMTGALVSLKIE